LEGKYRSEDNGSCVIADEADNGLRRLERRAGLFPVAPAAEFELPKPTIRDRSASAGMDEGL